MRQDDKYQKILNEYPSIITKEQLYKICNISKRTASHLLENGLIPCKCSEKKTHKYKIASVDVVKFLKKRDNASKGFNTPHGWYKKGCGKETTLSPKRAKKLRTHFDCLMSPYPDVLSVKEAGEITGYSSSTVTKWCSNNYIHHFYIRRKFFIPKPSLLDYMVGTRFRGFGTIPKSPNKE